MILLIISVLIALILGLCIGMVIGSKHKKVVDSAITDVKDKVDNVHTKADSLKDDMIAIEGKVDTIKDVISTLADIIGKDNVDKLETSAKDFVTDEINQLDKIVGSDGSKVKLLVEQPTVAQPKAGEVKTGIIAE